jgi:hypothetical protein
VSKSQQRPYWRLETIWCQCQRCSDTFDVVLYILPVPGQPARAQLEATSAASLGDGRLWHRPGRCGGLLRLVDLPQPVILERRDGLRDVMEAVQTERLRVLGKDA